VPDLPFRLHDATREARVVAAFDPEGKVRRALEELAPFEGRRVLLLGEAPALERALADRGAEVTATHRGLALEGDPSHAATGMPAGSADVVVAPWTGFDGVADPAELAEARRVLAPEGRLLVLQDYGRDDLTAIRGPERTAHLVARSRRDGWLLRSGFRVHVIHAWWRFADLDEAGELLVAAFGPAAATMAGALRRPQVAHNVAIYHRSRDEEPGPDPHGV
jgi:SAM-dependent methyltransferase